MIERDRRTAFTRRATERGQAAVAPCAADDARGRRLPAPVAGGPHRVLSRERMR